MDIRSELHPQSVGKHTYFPLACHPLSKKRKANLFSVFPQCENVTKVLFKC